MGTYLGDIVPFAAAAMPWAVAVALPVPLEAQAQSILPDNVVASAASAAPGAAPTGAINGLIISVLPEICGVSAEYVMVITPVAAAMLMADTYLVALKAAFHDVAAAVTPAMSFDWNPSDTATLADPARFRPSVTFERMV